MALIKTLFLLFLALYFIAGLSLLITGSVAHRHASKFMTLTGSAIMSGAGFIISLGVFIIILSVLGVVGAYRNRLGLLKIFIGSLVLILLLQFIAVIVGFTLRNKADKQLHDKLINSLKKYASKDKDVMAEWDLLQEKWSCCGVDNSTDWITHAELVKPPTSCCIKADCSPVSETEGEYFKQGCYEAARNLFFKYSKALGGVSLFFLFIEIIGVVLAISLLRDVKNNYGNV